MKNKSILIISATSFSNYNLSSDIKKILDQFDIQSEIINLEEYDFPLFLAKTYESKKNNIRTIIEDLAKKFACSSGLVICAPEYNGSIPPIITNFIAWMSVSTDYWRDAFQNKIAVVASSSGGEAIKYNIAMKNQLEHLGSIVMPRPINITSNKSFNSKSAKKILSEFVNLL